MPEAAPEFHLATNALAVCLISSAAFGLAGSFSDWTSGEFALAGLLIGFTSVTTVIVVRHRWGRASEAIGFFAGAVVSWAVSTVSLRHDQDSTDALIGRTLLGAALSGLCVTSFWLWTQVIASRRDQGSD